MKTLRGTGLSLLPVTRAAAPASTNSASWRRLRSLPPAPLVGTEKAVSFAPIHAAMKTTKATTVVDTPASDRAAGGVSSCAAPAGVTLMTSSSHITRFLVFKRSPPPRHDRPEVRRWVHAE